MVSSRSIVRSDGTPTYRDRGWNRSDRARSHWDSPPNRGDLASGTGQLGSDRGVGENDSVLPRRSCKPALTPAKGAVVWYTSNADTRKLFSSLPSARVNCP